MPKNNGVFRYKSLSLPFKSWKIDNIVDLTQQFTLSIFNYLRYQSTKITWLLPIFIDWLLRVLCVTECLGGHNQSVLIYWAAYDAAQFIKWVSFFWMEGGGGGGGGISGK